MSAYFEEKVDRFAKWMRLQAEEEKITLINFSIMLMSVERELYLNPLQSSNNMENPLDVIRNL